jgi:hypothetical protein
MFGWCFGHDRHIAMIVAIVEGAKIRRQIRVHFCTVNNLLTPNANPVAVISNLINTWRGAQCMCVSEQSSCCQNLNLIEYVSL